jgi:hypothetical protein
VGRIGGCEIMIRSVMTAISWQQDRSESVDGQL